MQSFMLKFQHNLTAIAVVLLVVFSTNMVFAQCDNVTGAGQIGPDASGCLVGGSYDPPMITSIADPSGGTGALEIIWLFSITDPALGDNWTTVAGATGLTYDPTPVTQTTWYRRCSRRAGCSAFPGESNNVKMTVATVCSTPACAGNLLLSNAGFESGLTGWDVSNATEVIVGHNPYSGLQSVSACGATSEGINREFNFVIGNNYTVSFYGKTTTPALWSGVGISFYDAAWVEIAGNSTAINSTNYAHYTASSTAPAGTVHAKVFAWHVVNACFEVDDICLTTTPPCDNITNAGQIGSDAIGCTSNGSFDPPLITSISLPSGGTGTIEYVWLYKNASNGWTFTVIGGANSPTYDPTPITEQTIYRRCSRRSGCSSYDGESNDVTMDVNTMPVVTANYPAPVCAGTAASLTASLTAGGAVTYAWSNGATGATISVSPTTTTIYTVTATDIKGCTGTASREVTVFIAPTFMITNAVCTQGTNTTDTADDRWSLTVNATAGNPTSGTFQVLYNGGVIDNGTYGTPKVVDMGLISAYGANATISIRDFNYTCTSSHTVAVPTGCSPASCVGFDFANKTVTCNGASMTICYDVIGAANRYWGTSVKYTNDPLNHGYMLTSGFGNQTGVCTTINDPAKIANIMAFNNSNVLLWGMINANAAGDMIFGTGCEIDQLVPYTCCSATGSIAGNTSFCTGGSTTLTAAGGNTYAWSNGATGASLIVTTAGTYTVTATTGACATTASVVITQNALPTAAITGGGNGCVTAATALTATGGASYAWNTGANTATINVTPVATTTYTVTVTNAAGCTATATKVLNAVPTVLAVSAVSKLCAGDATDLTASATGATAYAWSTGANTAVITVSPAASTTYTVTVTFATGCTATTSVQLEVLNTIIVSTATPTNSNSCTTPNGSISVSASGSAGTFLEYRLNSGVWQASNNFTGLAAGTYIVQVRYQGGYCGFTYGIVTINNTPPTISAVSAVAAICGGETTQLTAGGGVSYVWNTGSTGASINVSPAATATYTVTATAANGCTGTATVQVVVRDLIINTSLTANNLTSCTTNNGSILVNATGNSGALQYRINGGAWQSSNTFTGLGAGTYIVEVSYVGNFCAYSFATATLTAPSAPVVTATSATICAMGSTNITASGAATYVWNAGGTAASLWVMPNATTTYTVTGTATNGCTATATSVVTVNPLPTVSVSPTTSAIFTGGSSTLTATGATTYTWNTGATGATLVATTAGTYTVTGTDANGCTKTATAVVTETAAPTVTPATICAGATATVTATGGTAYTWSNGGATASISIAPSTTTTYTVTVTNGAISTTLTTVVTVNPLPVVAATSATICLGQTATISASGTTNYAWNTGSTANAITASPTTTTTYTVTGTNANGCTATATGVITVNPLPTAAVTPASSVIFAGSSTTLTATGGVSYAWSNGATTATNTVSAPGTYTVTVTNANGCTATATAVVTETAAPTVTLTTICAGATATVTATGGTAYTWSNGGATASISVSPITTTTYTVTVTNGAISTTLTTVVTVNPLPVVGITGGLNGCFITSADLTATGGGTYLWSTGATSALINVAPSATTTYTVTVTNANGCTATATKTLSPAPSISAIAAVAAICGGESTQLTANGGVSYVWNTNATTASINVSPSATAIYTVTATAANGCTKSATVEVVVRDLIINTSLTANNLTSCTTNNGSILVNATGNSGALQYRINGGAWQSSNTFTGLGAGTYIVEVSYVGNFCAYSFATATLTAPSAPTAEILSNGLICGGNAATMTAQGGVSYLWNTGATTAVITSATAGTYTVTVTNAAGCTATATKLLIIDAIPSAIITTSVGSTIVCANQPVNLTVNTMLGATFAWSNGGTTATINVTPAAATIYTVTVTTPKGCTAVASISLTTKACGTASIGDFVWFDGTTAVKNGAQDSGEAGIAGVTVTLYNATNNNIVATTITNGRGYYNFNSLFAGSYIVGFTPKAGLTFTTQTLNTANGSDADIATGKTPLITLANGQVRTDIDAGMVRIEATKASLGDKVWFDNNKDGIQNNSEAGVPNVTVRLFSTNGTTLIATTTTNALGQYIFTDLAASGYRVQFDLPINTVFTTSNIGDDQADSDADATGLTAIITLGAGDNITTVDAGIYNPSAGTGSIGNFVWDDKNVNGLQDLATERGEPGIKAILYGADGITVLATTFTDANGFYLFGGLSAGEYIVAFENLPTNFLFTSQTLNTANGSDVNSIGRTDLIVLTAGENKTDIDAGIFENSTPIRDAAAIGNFVWSDNDGNGQQDANELGISGVTVSLYNPANVLIAKTTTDNDGFYAFTGLAAGAYYVVFTDLPQGAIFTPANNVADDALDSDANTTTGRTQTVTLAGGETNSTLDAGLVQEAFLGDFVWLDGNKNGVQELGEGGVQGVTVELFESTNLTTPVQTTATDASGSYYFRVNPNTYVVKFGAKAGFTRTITSGSPDSGSDADQTTGLTAPVTIGVGQRNYNVDAGLYTTTLPVKMIYFVGAERNCTVNLKWQTATELNNKVFIVQRSTDGKSFVNIGEIAGAGTTNTPNIYEFNDPKPVRNNYYRIQQVDFDGTTTIYNSANSISTKGCFDDTENGVDVLYPNPNATDIAAFKFYTEQAAEEAVVEVMDNLGRILQVTPINISTGPNVVTFDIADLPTGNYMVRIKGNGWFTNAQKLVRMK
jgi:SdrD B-like domain/Secretion system C-terminal sorting domain